MKYRFDATTPTGKTLTFTYTAAAGGLSNGSVTLRRRFNKQLFVRATYTYSKSIDESSNTGGTIAYNFPIAQDSRNLKGERGRSGSGCREV